jgi:hypothetical protein
MNLKLIYPSGDPDQVTYTVPINYDYEPEFGHLEEGQEVTRAFDGTAHRYTDFDKKYFELQFTYVLKAQFDYFTQLYRFHCDIDLYLDGTNLDATVIMMAAPSGGPAAAFDENGDPTYSFSVRFEEV